MDHNSRQALRKIFLLIIFVCPTYLFSQSWTKISCGGEFSIGIKADSSLWGWGSNKNGQCGIGSVKPSVPLPSRTKSGGDWVAVSAGGFHCLGLKKNGTLWGWGSGLQGQVGLGSAFAVNDTPQQIGTHTDWAAISAGFASSYAINSSGTLYAWGYNIYGELGDSTTNAALSPIQVHSTKKFKAVAAGGISASAIAADGTMWTWGYGGDGQLGNNGFSNEKVPVQVGKDTDWVNVVSGFEFSIAQKRNGTIWSWGYNSSGQCGQGDTNIVTKPTQIGTDNNWKYIAAGSTYAFGIKDDSSLYAWGSNFYCDLGIADTTSQLLPVRVGNSNDWVSISGATGIIDGTQVIGLHSIGLKKGYSGYCGTGQNYIYQLGNNSDTLIPVFDCNMGIFTSTEPVPSTTGRIKIFPNPSSGQFFVRFSDNDPSAKQIFVKDVTGKTLFAKYDQQDNSIDFDLSNYPKGVYFLEIVSGDATDVEKVVID